jgi:DNA polymerase-3 subunit gamma/tau
VEQNLALYRRYRPETFAEVIGQDHVTGPLRQALANNRVNHAYLFSGPRGCGKTTSARILARTLNCEKAPVADPCGECQSCRDLARGGPGSIDVIEIDAASHGGVDDARDLRERAFFAPVSSRYKVYIIDEAHMVTAQGFNALLKLVEEPPEHLKFIFATTEPEKVIPTIRSRTHHYPFRLIPPRLLSDYLAELCAKEGVRIDPAALPLVVRAGGGSARDSLSVLDQLLGGAGQDGVTYDVAAALLGYTPDNLLDDVVDGFAAGDGASVFRVVDKVIESGQDPRRFTEDVLRRLRDLVIVAQVPDAPASGLIDAPEDQAERLVAQAARFGAAQLVRAADAVATGLTEMRGATTPRLLLELICARVLLPEADDAGLVARVERIERRLEVAGSAPPAAPAPTPPAPVVEAPAAAEPVSEGTPEPNPAPVPQPPVPSRVEAPAEARVEAPVERAPEPATATTAPGTLGLADVRRIWPDLLERVKERRRFTWILLSQNAQVLGLDGDVLTLGMKNAGARESFVGGGSDEILRAAARELVGADWRVEAIVDPSADPDAHGAPRVRQPAVPPERAAGRGREQAAAEHPAQQPTQQPAQQPAPQAEQPAQRPARTEPAVRTPTVDPDAHADRDDPDADEHGLDSQALLERELGATVIEEITHE